MPHRDQNHILGDDAVTAFKTIFREWPVNEVGRNDYGVDADVDVFRNEYATGNTFKAQIKGKNRLDGKTVTVKIKASTFNYWLSLGVPVLVFCYVRSSGDCYGRWAHSFSPSTKNPAQSSNKKGKKKSPENKDGITRQTYRSLTFKFDAEHRLTATSVEKIARQVSTVRLFKDRVRVGPVPVAISSSDPGLDIEELSSTLNGAFLTSGGIFRVAGQVDDPDICAHTRFDRTSFSFLMPVGLSSLKVHGAPSQTIAERGLDSLVADVIIAGATELAALGLSKHAVTLCEMFQLESQLPLGAEIAGRLCGAYLDEEDVDGAIKMLAPPLISPDPVERDIADQMLHPIVSSMLNKASERGVDVLVVVLDKRIAVEVEQGSSDYASNYAYLKADIQKVRKRLNDAIATYREVAELSPRYLRRGYYHRELGGCFADQWRWHEAAECYLKARACGHPLPDAEFVLVDALFQAGCYRDALNVAIAAYGDDAYFLRKTKLLKLSIEWVLNFVRCERQDRHQFTPLGAKNVPKELTLDQLARILASTDALDGNGPASYMHLFENDADLALRSVLIMAHTALVEGQWWTLALTIAVDAGYEADILDAIAEYLVRFCRDQIPEHLESLRRTQSEKLYKKTRKIINAKAAQPPREPPYVVRIFDPDGHCDMFELHPSGEVIRKSWVEVDQEPAVPELGS